MATSETASAVSLRAISSIYPACSVCAFWRGLDHPLRHRRHVALMHGTASHVVRIFRVTREAVFAPLAINDLGFGRRILSCFEKILHLVHGIVQIPVVH